MLNFFWPYQGPSNGCRAEAYRSHTVSLHVEHFLAIDNPVTHEQSANGLSNTDRRGHAIVSRLSCASGRLINNITAMLARQRHNVFINTCMVSLMLGAALQECGLKGCFVEKDGERCIIGAGFFERGGQVIVAVD